MKKTIILTNVNFYMYEITIDEFSEYNSPCKECLVQGMCLHDEVMVDYNTIERYIRLSIDRPCERFKEYICNNKLFEIKGEHNSVLHKKSTNL